ncbi:MAG: thiol-disulfide isomerase/thioredoxin [Planctomycetota bacterium]|jgi:thiol-disulfide isomerase/thioredoxin
MNKQHGATQVIIAIIVLIIVLGAIVLISNNPKAEQMLDRGEGMMEEGSEMMKEAQELMDEGEEMVEEASEMMDQKEVVVPEGSAIVSAIESVSAMYVGGQIAGNASPLLEFTQVDYDAAIAENKLVMLYFYANWCPFCIEEFSKETVVFFDTLESDQVVGFRVHYRDGDTSSAHKDITKKHNVISQHTKVFIKDGQQVLKTPETWGVDRYTKEIATLLQ